MTIRILQVDAFTDTPFSGNPAAVAFLASSPPGPDGDAAAGPSDTDRYDDGFLQALAAEMNLSETAFPLPRPDGDWDLRWFTPGAEVDLCGHATLATAHVLFELGLVGDDVVTFHTRSGPLICHRQGDAIMMDFPAAPATPCGPVAGLVEALGATVVDQGQAFDLIAQLESAEAVASLTPDLGALAQIDTRAVVVTAAGDIDRGPANFVSRVFAPRVGIPEDPVTGSAHCITGPWWAERLGRSEFQAHQVSARGGRLGVAINGDRVELTGQAVTVLDGTFLA